MPLAFDTGSAGVTLYAEDIFPSTLVSSAGFVIPEGQSSITYNGITVTNQQGVRKYGYATNGRSQTGNIGYATITFGNADGQLTTQVMPVFLYYLITDNATGNPEPVPIQRGWFGVNSGPGFINVTNSTEPSGGYPVCAASTLGSCRVASVFKYFSYASGVDAGFMLNPAALQSCDITVADDCTPAPILTIGLTQAAGNRLQHVEPDLSPIDVRGSFDYSRLCGMPSEYSEHQHHPVRTRHRRIHRRAAFRYRQPGDGSAGPIEQLDSYRLYPQGRWLCCRCLPALSTTTQPPLKEWGPQRSARPRRRGLEFSSLRQIPSSSTLRPARKGGGDHRLSYRPTMRLSSSG